MRRYIDADALYKVVTEKYYDITAGCYPYNIVAYDMARLVKNAPTADVVEVVRCKDCSYADILPSGLYRCRLHSVYSMFGNSIFNVIAEDYCSRAERSENGTQTR